MSAHGIMQKTLGFTCAERRAVRLVDKVRALLSSAGYEDAVVVEKATLHPKINSVEINGTDSFYDMPQHIYEHYKKIESCHTSKEQILTLNVSHPKDWRDLYN